MTTHELRRTSFDKAASQYDRVRPSYPPELAADLLQMAAMPNKGTILEIGCGTGKATRLFVDYGYALTCLEPGQNLTAVARENFRDLPNVTIENTMFETWLPRGRLFDLIICAQAFHWLDPDVAQPKTAALLKETGRLGLFWNRPDPADALNFDPIYERIVPEIVAPQSPNALNEWIESKSGEIVTPGLFDLVDVKLYPWQQTYNGRAYIDLISTYSDHYLLPAEKQNKLYQAILNKIDRLGGKITKKYVAVLFVAKRK